MEPSTVYGISKQAAKDGVNTTIIFWCRCKKHPLSGFNQWSSPPGGGTTDYAVDIFHKALSDKKYECFYPQKLKCR
jgi:hypothetical protein